MEKLFKVLIPLFIVASLIIMGSTSKTILSMCLGATAFCMIGYLASKAESKYRKIGMAEGVYKDQSVFTR